MLLTPSNRPIATDNLIGKLKARRDMLGEMLGHRIRQYCSQISSADLTSTSMLLTPSNRPIATDSLIGKLKARPDMLGKSLGHRIRQYCS